MRIVYKYPIAVGEDQTLHLPKGAKWLAVQVQRDIPCLWAEIDLNETDTEARHFSVIGTGHTFGIRGAYIGTFQLYDGDFVGHVYETTA